MKIDDIEQYIELMEKHDLMELKIQEEDRKIHLKKSAPPQPAPAIYAAPMAGIPAQMMPGGVSGEEVVDNNFEPIKSPIVGTFYRAPSPEADSFVEIGTTVTPDTTVCIVEAMKVMNEIKAEVEGVIKEILIENGQPVEFGAVMFYVEPV